ncbi:hypothetical protein DF186_19165, partial [Enterococcus hirae]
QVPVQGGALPAGHVRELAVGRTADGDEVADAHQPAFGQAGDQAGKQQAVIADLAQAFDPERALQLL